MAPVSTLTRLTRAFLWICVIAWGVLVGAKLFDLRVLVGAWSAAPPQSLQLLPYGKNWPVDTGEFFIPLSAALLLASLGALLSGWRTPPRFRIWLAVSLAMIFGVLILTVTQFWPRNAALWAVARGAPNAMHDPDAILRMVQQWVTLDWVRVAMGSIGLLASIRAISLPFPVLEPARPATLALKIAYAAGIAAVLTLAIYMASNI